jgi:hypothetical protein
VFVPQLLGLYAVKCKRLSLAAAIDKHASQTRALNRRVHLGTSLRIHSAASSQAVGGSVTPQRSSKTINQINYRVSSKSNQETKSRLALPITRGDSKHPQDMLLSREAEVTCAVTDTVNDLHELTNARDVMLQPIAKMMQTLSTVAHHYCTL